MVRNKNDPSETLAKKLTLWTDRSKMIKIAPVRKWPTSVYGNFVKPPTRKLSRLVPDFQLPFYFFNFLERERERG